MNAVLPDLAIRTLDDEAIDTTLLEIAAGRKMVIGMSQKEATGWWSRLDSAREVSNHHAS